MKLQFIFLLSICCILQISNADETLTPATPPHTNVDLIESTITIVSPYGDERFRDLTSFWGKSMEVMNDFLNLYNPDIIKINNSSSSHYRMYIFGWPYDFCNQDLPGCDSIFFIESSNLEFWSITTSDNSNLSSPLKLTLSPGTRYWDEWHVGDPSVIKINDSYFMAYSAVGFDADGINAHADRNTNSDYKNDRDEFYYTIGGAYSNDGINWNTLDTPMVATKHEYAEKDPAMNAMFHRPSLMYDKDRFKIWFDYFNAAPLNRAVALTEFHVSLGYAELIGPPTLETFSSKNWTIRKGLNNPSIINWPNPEVLKLPFGYISFADPNGHQGSQWAARKTTMAYSNDGLDWKILGFIEHTSECGGNLVPEAYAESGILYLFTACIIDFHYSSLHVRKIDFENLEKLIETYL